MTKVINVHLEEFDGIQELTTDEMEAANGGFGMFLKAFMLFAGMSVNLATKGSTTEVPFNGVTNGTAANGGGWGDFDFSGM